MIDWCIHALTNFFAQKDFGREIGINKHRVFERIREKNSVRSNSIINVLLFVYSDDLFDIGFKGLFKMISATRISSLKPRFLAVVYSDSNITAFVLGVSIDIRIRIDIST